MSKSDNPLYVRRNSERPIFIILYVDDLVIGGEQSVDINKVKSLLFSKFEIERYKIASLLPRHWSDWDSWRHYDLPTTLHPKLTIEVWDDRVQACVNPSWWKSKTRCQLRHQFVGSLIYLTITRSDLSYPVSLLSQFIQTHLSCRPPWLIHENTTWYSPRLC